MFNVGDEVICVDDSFDIETASYFSPLPSRGRVYRVRAVGTDVADGKAVVWLHEIEGCMYIGSRERPLTAARFRKLNPSAAAQVSKFQRAS